MSNTKKNSVLYIITKLELGGAQKVCLSLLNGLNKNGDFAGIITGDEGALVGEVKNFESIFLLSEFKREVGIKNIFNEAKLFIKLIRIIKSVKKKQPNLIIHTHSTKAGMLGRWAAFFAGVKNIVHTIHGFGFHDGQNKIVWLIIYLAELATFFITTKFICVSDFDLNIGLKLFPFFKKRSCKINAAVDYEKFYIPAKKLENLKKDKFVVGTVSCFKPQKNLIDLLRAYKKLLDDLSYEKFNKKILLQIVGDGILRHELEEFVLKNNLEKNVEILGWQNDVSEYMHSWDLFVLSSLWEGLPCAVVEARLAKLPVIAYKISGIPEVVFNDVNGFLVVAGDWESLSGRIKLLVKDKLKYEQMSNYQDNLIDFKSSAMVQDHIRLYKSFF